MSLRLCVNCGRPLGDIARPDRRYCGVACRMAAHRARRAAERLTPVELGRLVDAVPDAAAEAALLRGIAEASRLDWHASAWLLSHRWPWRWGESGRVAAPAEDAELDDW